MSKWCVLTGGPHAGKTKTLERLSFLGYSVRPETARILIDNEMSKGRTLADIRRDGKAFQQTLVKMKLDSYRTSDRNERIFWDRGFPDSIVYMGLEQMDLTEIEKYCAEIQYEHVFLLAPMPVYSADYARAENAERAMEVHLALGACYERLGYEVHRIQVLTIEERVSEILEIVDGSKT